MIEEKANQMAKDVKKQWQKCEKEKQEYLEGWQRTKADFINYKQRENKLANEKIDQSNQFLLLQLLPILDDFQRLEEASKKKNAEMKNLKVAISQIKSQINQFLSDHKVIKIETKNQEFDPHFHEAVEVTKSSQPKNTILEEIRPGYLINEKLLRPTRVKLAE